MSIENKMYLFVSVLLIVMIAASAASIVVMNHSMSRTNAMLSDIAKCSAAQTAMQEETTAFSEYMRNQTQEHAALLSEECTRAAAAIDALPFDYSRIGEERYGRTWSIRNSYANYELARDAIMARGADSAGYVKELYRVYDMQSYLQEYLQRLQRITVQEESSQYGKITPLMQSASYFLLILTGVAVMIVMSISREFSSALVVPLKKLSGAAREMSRGNYQEEDITVKNQDELGELVTAFNSMKDATRENIDTLKENQLLSERLHREELTHVKMERELDTARLDLLQSQINPHFLFNTLNTISGMAELEDAPTTARMIGSLSAIFRYNLHTTEQFVSLSQELRVVEDYLYLQKMRFGDRLTYRINIRDNVRPDDVMLPVFLLQPLVENAVTHGVTKKEQGGAVSLTVWMNRGNVMITVEDTGVGIPADRLERIQATLQRRSRNAAGLSSPAMSAADPEQIPAWDESAGGANPEEKRDAGDTHGREESGSAGTAGDAPAGQAQQSQKRIVGIGLGNVAKRIHRIYRGGEITIDSREGVGTVCTLTLPQDEKIMTE